MNETATIYRLSYVNDNGVRTYEDYWDECVAESRAEELRDDGVRVISLRSASVELEEE